MRVASALTEFLPGTIYESVNDNWSIAVVEDTDEEYVRVRLYRSDNPESQLGIWTGHKATIRENFFRAGHVDASV